MSGRLGQLDLVAAIGNNAQGGEENRRDEGRRYDEGESRYDRDRRGGRPSYGGGYNDRGGDYHGNYRRRNDGYRNHYPRRDERRSPADADDNWRNKADADKSPETNRENSYASHRFGDRRDSRDFERRDGGRGYYQGPRHHGYHHDNRDYDRDHDRDNGERRYDRDYGDRHYDRGYGRGGYGRDNRRPRDYDAPERHRIVYDRDSEEIPQVRNEPLPMIHKDDNKFGALNESSDEETANMSLEQLKERAKLKNKEREQQTQKDLDQRNRAIDNMQAKANEPVPAVELHAQWSIDLPPRYSTLTLVQLPESRVSYLSSLAKSLNNPKKSKELEGMLGDANQTELPTMVYHIMASILRMTTLEGNYTYSVITFLTRVREYVDPAMVEDALQKCYVDPGQLGNDAAALEEKFVMLTKALGDNQLIRHLPSATPVEEAKATPAEEPSKEKEVKAEAVPAEAAKEDGGKNEEMFLELLKTGKMGEELSSAAGEYSIEKDAHLMFTLLQYIVGSHDPMDCVKPAKEGDNDVFVFVPFSANVYGELIYNFWDSLGVEVHVDLLNECVNYWDSVNQPQNLLDALFYTIFKNSLVYEDALSVWMEQDKTPLLQKAYVSINNTLFQIQEMLNSNQEELRVY